MYVPLSPALTRWGFLLVGYLMPPRKPPTRASFWPRRGTTQTQAGLREGFRSGLEEKNADHMRALGYEVHFETLKIPYVIPESAHSYTPDFPLENGIIAETKGRWLADDRAKHLLIREQYPDLDIRLVFDNPNSKITPGSKTTLAMWAEKHGFKWAKKLVPKEWLEESGPVKKPGEVLQHGPLGYRLTPKKANSK